MEVISGHLTVKVSGILKDKVFPKHWCVLYSGRNTLPPCLEVIGKCTTDSEKKCIELERCRWCKAETIDPAFSISVKGKQYTFVAESEVERCEWVNYLSCVTPELSDQHQDKPGMQGSKSTIQSYDEMVMQDNVLYSSPTDQIFKFDVIADHSKGNCSELNFKGLYNLQFDTNSISLIKYGTREKMAVWNYTCIRTYGHSTHTVSFNVGKKSSTGEGQFSFLTTNAKRMIEIITQQTEKLKSDADGEPKRKNSQSNDFGLPDSNANVSKSTTSKPPVAPKSKLTSTSSSSSVKSGGTATSGSAKRRPAPVSPSGNTSNVGSVERKNSVGIDTAFVQQLKTSLAPPSSPSPSTTDTNKKRSLKSASSLENISSASNLSKKELKKQKELEKEMKKRERKEAKEREEREKKERKAQKELEKKEKKGKNNGKADIMPPDYSQIVDDPYAQPNDSENAYTYVDDNVPQKKSQDIAGEGQYAAPWTDILSTAGSFPAPPPPINEEDVYACPQKRNTVRKKEPDVIDCYEDVQNLESPKIPERIGEDDELANNNVYHHFHNPDVVPASMENIYGMESASAPLCSVENNDNTNSHSPVKQDSVDTNVYESF